MQKRPFVHWFIPPIVFLALYLWVSVSFKTSRLFLSTIELFSGPQIGRNRSTFPGATHAEVLQHSPQISDGVSTISENELTVIIPVDESNLSALPSTLSHFESPFLRQVLLLCPESVSLQVEASLKDLIMSGNSFNHAAYSVISRRDSRGLTDAMVQAMSTESISSSNWILISDEHGLEGIHPSSREQLLHPPSIDYPTGPRGIRLFSHHSACLSPSFSFQAASYLVPPFVIPANLVRGLGSNPRTWLELGEIVSNCLPGDFGGLVSPVLDADAGGKQDWCLLNTSSTGSLQAHEMANDTMILGAATNAWKNEGVSADVRPLVFVSIFSMLEELRLFAPVICSLQSKGIRVYSLLDTLYDSLPGTIQAESCMLSYETSLEALSVLDPGLTILITTPDLGHHLEGATNIRIPRSDLPYCSWMTSLTEAEWRDWHRPQLTISVITKDRPASLIRLLTSISSGLYFGDQVDMRIYLEQSADYETMQTVKQYSWSHGSLFLHHRIIHGGLLPAVVESWYPHTNDSYGLLLEDDVELSPLFYAWIKMSLLRYRYGTHVGKYPNLFGISLYQQKSIELHTEGRKPFNASHLFLSHNLPPFTPYLSQIPCSWGAVYFPEHWSEFHDYLTIRFSEMTFKIDDIVVPDIRSNRWTKSWKKFFIELVYLRGYVMLYPNFPDYMSLSTNHLEVGSHVKVRSQAKRDAFVVPLMQLPVNDRQSLGILKLPGGTLPTNPPVLNLTGSLSTMHDLAAIGSSRRTEMLNCDVQESVLHLFDARSLLCLS